MTKKTERRLARLRVLWKRYMVDPTNTKTTANEDAGILLAALEAGTRELGRYLSLTFAHCDGRLIFYGDDVFDTLAEAKAHGIANVADDIYPEAPLRIFDLESKESWYPVWSSLKWAPNQTRDA